MRNEKGQFIQKNPFVEGTCRACNKGFVRESWRTGQTLCSKECRAAIKRGVRLKSYIPLSCKSCGKEFGVQPSRAKTATYCSWECKKKNTPIAGFWDGKQRINMMGESNPAWRGGITKFSEYKTTMHKKYTAQKKMNGGKHTNEEWEMLKLKTENSCLSCLKKEPKIKLTKDHILPIALGGTDDIENIQPLCQSCNSWKNKKYVNFASLCLSPI